MKCVIAMRILRFVHWSRRSYKNIDAKPSDASTKSMSTARGDDDNSEYDWEKIEDDDDDGVPLWKAENWIPVNQQLQRQQQKNVRETTPIKVEHDMEKFCKYY